MSDGPIARRPWLWVIAAFIALIAAWTILITIARKHIPEEVPMHRDTPAEGGTHGR